MIYATILKDIRYYYLIRESVKLLKFPFKQIDVFTTLNINSPEYPDLVKLCKNDTFRLVRLDKKNDFYNRYKTQSEKVVFFDQFSMIADDILINKDKPILIYNTIGDIKLSLNYIDKLFEIPIGKIDVLNPLVSDMIHKKYIYDINLGNPKLFELESNYIIGKIELKFGILNFNFIDYSMIDFNGTNIIVDNPYMIGNYYASCLGDGFTLRYNLLYNGIFKQYEKIRTERLNNLHIN